MVGCIGEEWLGANDGNKDILHQFGAVNDLNTGLEQIDMIG